MCSCQTHRHCTAAASPSPAARPASAWETLSLGHEDLTENFCTNNENVEQLKKLYEQGKK